MSGVNRVILIGHLGRDPEVRYVQSGEPVCNFTLATTERWKDKQDERQEATEWHAVVVWGKTAEACGQYLSKGSQAYVEGSIRTRKWEDKEGNPRETKEIRATSVQFLGGGDKARDKPAADSQQQPNLGSDPW